ncbi:MAG TPA: acyltransferase domain-containing protein, partial [Blastocatellia bacterium]|nr:acyltransferase domain-containing protein [Blastocatellia bacterium]
VLALKHRRLPPSLHFERPNPEIDFDNSPFYVNSRLREWKSDGSRLRAGVSAFGVGGTNAHVILEEAPEREPGGASREYKLILLSARSGSALESASRNLTGHLGEHTEQDLVDVAYTLQVGRKRMSHRRMVVCRDAPEAARLLESNARVFAADREGESPPLVFMFPGQGSQYVNMGRRLYEGEREFRKQVELCSEVLREPLGFDLRRVLYPPEGMEREAEAELNETRITQPALFVVEYAMAKKLGRWGIRPDAMIGHSLGEYVAACLSGVMRIEDALRLVSKRGEMMQEARGGMVAVMMGEAKARERINGSGLSIAAVNGPQQVVISGVDGAVEKLIEELSREGMVCKKLKARQAFHSKMMDGAAARFVEEVRKVELRRGEIEYISNVSGKTASAEEVTDPRYWGRQLRECVRFGDGIEELMKRPGVILLEVGPGDSLSKLVRQAEARTLDEAIVSTMRNSKDARHDSEYLTTAVGKLWMAGAEIDWASYYEGEKRGRVELPTYPFERRRYWIEARSGVEAVRGSGADGKADGKANGKGGYPEASQVEAMDNVTAGSVSLHSRPELPNAYVAPVSDREKTIAAIWQLALGVDMVGVDDNFFELGGDSLIAIQVISQLKEKFKIEIPVAGLYERLTVRSLDALISSLSGEDQGEGESGIDSGTRGNRVLQRKRFQEEKRLRKSGRHADHRLEDL